MHPAHTQPFIYVYLSVLIYTDADFGGLYDGPEKR